MIDSCAPRPLPATRAGFQVRPELVRKIALWWQAELDKAAREETPDPPSHDSVMKRFQCSEEEALRGVGLGEHRHFAGIE